MAERRGNESRSLVNGNPVHVMANMKDISVPTGNRADHDRFAPFPAVGKGTVTTRQRPTLAEQSS